MDLAAVIQALLFPSVCTDLQMFEVSDLSYYWHLDCVELDNLDELGSNTLCYHY